MNGARVVAPWQCAAECISSWGAEGLAKCVAKADTLADVVQARGEECSADEMKGWADRVVLARKSGAGGRWAVVCEARRGALGPK